MLHLLDLSLGGHHLAFLSRNLLQPSDPLTQFPCFALDNRRRRIGGVVCVGQTVIVAQSRLSAESVLYLMSSLSDLEPRHGFERLVKSHLRFHFDTYDTRSDFEVP